MKSNWRSISRRKLKRFVPATLEEDTDETDNPFRGWYRIVYYMLGEDIDIQIEDSNRQRQENLELAIINISKYKECDIADSDLKCIQQILDNYTKHGAKVILRVVYDHEGIAREKEPFNFSIVLRHIEQIGEIIAEYADTIFVYQGLLIGNWGEMHSSRFVQNEKLVKLMSALRDNCDNKVYRVVRTPAQWRILHSEIEYDTKAAYCKEGIFDDAILGSASHMGTFGENRKNDSGWQQPWNIEDELEFEDRLCQYVPNGGEMVFPLEGEMLCSEKLLLRLRKMHITYLNNYYDTKILDRLKNQLYSGEGVWNGKSLYEYIGAHMGYRYVVREAYADFDLLNQKKKFLHICLENTGFAYIYKKVSVFIEWSELGGTTNRECILEDLRDTNGNNIVEIVHSASHLKGNVYVLMELTDSREVIRFANKTDTSGRVFIGAFQ